MSLNEIIQIHKQNNLGFSSNLPKFILKLWYYWQLYGNRSCILFTEENRENNKILGFILFDINRNEIVVMAVDKNFQNNGIGKRLLLKLPKEKIMVIHRDNHEQSRMFYKNNGFIMKLKLSNNLILSERK